MMHDTDDATLMQALRDADPVDVGTLDVAAHVRHERRRRDPGQVPAGHGVAYAPAVRSRRLQLVAAVLAAVVVTAGVGALSTVLAQRGPDTRGAAERPEARAVPGSYRAIVEVGGDRAYRVDVAGDVLRVRPERARAFEAPQAWQGVYPIAPVLVDQQIIAAGDAYLYAGAPGQQGPRWHRYIGTEALLEPDLTPVPLPVFADDTQGFTQVADDRAAAQDLARYSADVATADLGFLGPFAPQHHDLYRRGEASVDVLVDREGRVRRVEEMVQAAPEQPTVTRFEQLDGLAPIATPSPDRALATDARGITIEAAGDATLGDALRERVITEIERDDEVVAYRFVRGPDAGMSQSEGAADDDVLFVVAVLVEDGLSGQRLVERLSGLAVGTEDDGATVEGYAYLSGVSIEQWLELDS